MPARPIAGLALAVSLAAVACSAASDAPPETQRPALGVMTTLPLLWDEAADVGELLAPQAQGSWVKDALERRFVLEPLDALEEASLARIDRLMLAQPRALSPEENVALDRWVRRGGTLLLFADPMLTRHSRFPIGDRRRPQDVVLLSPILAHWGLELLFDDEQPEGGRAVALDGVEVPVNLAGRFAIASGTPCEALGGGVAAVCRIGKGRVVAWADAAVLDDAELGDSDLRGPALDHLLGRALAP